MDLVALVGQEIAKYNLKEPLEIAYYLYIKTGQLFRYNPAFQFMEKEEAEKIKKEQMNILDVKTFNIICFSWSHLYVDLLKSFGIAANVIKTNSHAFVEIEINSNTYQADLTVNGGEMALIKMGLQPFHFREIIKGEAIEPTTGTIAILHQNFCEKGICSNELLKNMDQLEKVLQYLNKIFNEKAKDSTEAYEEYIYYVYKEVAKIVNSPEYKLGFVSGRKMIDFLLEKYIGIGYKPNFTHFYNKEKTSFIEVYTVIRENVPYYFAYQKTASGFYELQEVPSLYIECLINIYNIDHKDNLVILPKPDFPYANTLGSARA